MLYITDECGNGHGGEKQSTVLCMIIHGILLTNLYACKQFIYAIYHPFIENEWTFCGHWCLETVWRWEEGVKIWN